VFARVLGMGLMGDIFDFTFRGALDFIVILAPLLRKDALKLFQLKSHH
jgi:hypothetical protein